MDTVVRGVMKQTDFFNLVIRRNYLRNKLQFQILFQI